VLSEYLTISIQGTDNPFREHILPLVYQHQGILHALLGLSACHMHISGRNESQRFVTISLQYQGLALHSLGALLLQEEVSGLTPLEEECVLGMVLLLVLHDVHCPPPPFFREANAQIPRFASPEFPPMELT
jgi:hypothetical protein